MRTIIYFFTGILFFSCNTKDKSNTSLSDTQTQYVNRTDTVYLVRNADITPANAYSDLFLDSTMVEDYLRSNNISADSGKGFRSFYNYRNMQYAWFTSQGLTEQAKGFWNLQDKLGTKADKSLRNRMDTLLNNDSLIISRFDTTIARTELALTKAFIDFYRTHRDKTHFAGISPEMAVPVKKLGTMALADTLARQRTDTSNRNGASAAQYQKLQQKLLQYTTIAKQGGWGTVPSVRNLKKGSSSPAVAAIKKRLQLSGDLAPGDTSAVLNDTLINALKNYQARNGMGASGNITDTLIRSLNMPVEYRIQQLIVNLNRAQWMPAAQDQNYIGVNIPDYLLTVYENNTKAFEMPVAVGKQGTNTTMFTGDLNQIVFSPYWNIPASIVKNEILPQMKRNPNYLKSKNMEQVGKNDSMPTLRQLPGKDNALGKVKFLFPNRYDIYFHDTYAKEVFNKKNRAVSHGCIRLQDAEKLATYLLRNNNSWTPEKIRTAMNSTKEQYVKLDPSMPVVITYYTAWVDETGQLNFRDDLYGNDARLTQMMFEKVTMPVGVRDSVKSPVNKMDTGRKVR